MGKPRLIILIRHAQSEGNKNREIHQTIPDHRVKLTPDGWTQAHEAGRKLRSLLRADDTIHFFTSPYRRTRETTEGILSTLTSDDHEPSPFKRNNITVHEEPRLREQDFGNFQPCSAEMERMWQERADYGHFFYRIPNGESAADAYDRVSGFNESLWRQFGDDDFASVCVLVTHGLMSRIFLMKWYHFSVEYFEDLRNVNHCEFLIMRKEDDTGKYLLENKLRTWSELRRERSALKEKEQKEKEKQGEKEVAKLERQNSSPVVPRRWGGCPEGCNHSKHFRVRRELAELRQVDEHRACKAVGLAVPDGTNDTNGNGSTLSSRRPATKKIHSHILSDDDTDDPRGHDGPRIDISKARDDVVSSPDGTPSFITIEDRLRHQQKSPKSNIPLLHVGRDFGGTYSGHTSAANSDTELSEEDAKRRLSSIAARVKTGDKSGQFNMNGTGNANGMSNKSNLNTEWRRTQANRLGDASDNGSDACDEEEDDLAKAEKEDKSMEGSVY